MVIITVIRLLNMLPRRRLYIIRPPGPRPIKPLVLPDRRRVKRVSLRFFFNGDTYHPSVAVYRRPSPLFYTRRAVRLEKRNEKSERVRSEFKNSSAAAHLSPGRSFLRWCKTKKFPTSINASDGKNPRIFVRIRIPVILTVIL